MNDLVFVSLEAWDRVWRRNQHLVHGLLTADSQLRVLWIEPAVDLLHALRRHTAVRFGRGLRRSDDRAYSGRLHLLEPTKVLPRAVGPLADRALVGRALRATKSVGMVRPTIWINDPSWSPLVALTHWPSVYDVTDDWTLATRSAREQARVVEREQYLLTECAEVIVCSPALQSSKGARRSVTLVPNAVDVDWYRHGHPRPPDVPERYAVYVGTLHEDRLDVPLLLATADQVARVAGPTGRVVLVGPNALGSGNRASLERHPAITVLGARSAESVPGYLQHAHALLVPHVVDGFTRSLDPIKSYEYRATGVPIVSTPLPGFEQVGTTLAGVVTQDPSRFAAEVASLVAKEQVRLAPLDDVPKWGDRVDQVRIILERVRQGRSVPDHP